MSNSFDVKTVAIQVGALSNASRLLFPAPAAAQGGGISIVGAYVTSGTTTSSVMLTKYSSAGTPALNGTIAAAVGGTASAFEAGVPKAFSISSAYVSAGEWVAVAETNVQAMDTAAIVSVQYVMGK